MDPQTSKTSENEPENDTQSNPDDGTRRQPPLGRVEAMLRTYSKPQPDADEGSSGTPRSQKIKELYTVYEKDARMSGENEK